jgi:mutator protein MutT
MQNTTLLFLIKKEEGKIVSILLAKKKRGFGVGKYNGVGGKVESGESIYEAAVRETKEEIGVEVKNISKVAELEFEYLDKPEWNQLVHVYFCDVWTGEPSESQEVVPKWFGVNTIAYSQMWPDDAYWLRRVLVGEKLNGKFTFQNENIVNYNLEIVDALVDFNP